MLGDLPALSHEHERRWFKLPWVGCDPRLADRLGHPDIIRYAR